MTATRIEAVLTRLAEAGVDFVVIGGVAGLAHGSARVTFDVDICYSRTPENIVRLCEALGPLKPRLRGAPADLPFRLDPETTRSGLNFTLTTELGDLDILGEVSGLGAYEAVKVASATLHLYDLDIQVLSLDGLIAAKRAAGRGKDKEALFELEALKELARKKPT